MTRSILPLVLVVLVLGCQEPAEKPAEKPAPPAAPAPVQEATKPQEVVEKLGRQLKLVSTTAPAEVAAKAIRESYAGLVHPRLLDEWAAAPAKAPGRAVSSPWPDRIEVTSSHEAHGEAVVTGTLVEATSTGEAGRTPVGARLQRSGDSWLIVAFETGTEGEAEEESPAAAAVEVVQDYYRAIAARDYERAYAYWGPSGPPGQTREAFTAGFADTASVEVQTEPPSRIEPAAGSRYVVVPVTVVAKTKSGETQRFSGTYTLRRSVVDGASPAQRTWHLHRASLRRSGG